jgi:OFA family oxalate/formate antiporter-like MFS transporter
MAAANQQSTGSQPRGFGALWGSCAAIFWPGALAFGFPGVMAAHWQQTFGVGRGEVGATMFFLLVAVGCFMFLAGRLQMRLGVRRLMIMGGLVSTADMFLAAWAPSMAWIYAWAFILGASQCCIYISALTTVQEWFPARRGLVSGTVNLMFGGGAALMSPVFAWLLTTQGYAATVLIITCCNLVFIMAGAQFTDLPQHRGVTPPQPPGGTPLLKSMSGRQAMSTSAFWFFWATVACMGAAGIAMVTLSTNFGLSLGLDLERAVVILAVFNLGSSGSRLIMGWLSDVIERTVAMSWAFIAAAAAYFALPWLDGLWGPALLAGVVGFAFGTLFAVSAPLVVDCFGPLNFGEIFGLLFTSYGLLSGFLGPSLGGWLLDMTGGNFVLVFSYLGAMALAAGALVRLVRPPS